MGSRDTGVAEGQAMNAWIREVPMHEMANMLGIDELPMRRPNFDFYAHAVYHLQQMGFKGQELYHAAHEVMQRLFFSFKKGAPAVMYKYVKWYEKRVGDGLKPQPFDEFYQYAFRQKANTALTKLMGQKKKRGLSLDYEGGDQGEGGEFGQDSLEDTGALGPEQAASEREESEKRAEVFQEIPRMLSEHRLGDKYIPVWKLMSKNYKLQEMADELNAEGILAPGGGQWGTGSVHKVRNQIYGMVKRFLEQRGIDWESIVSSRNRKGFRFGFFPEG